MLDSDGTVLHQLLALPLRTDPEIMQPMKEITSVAMKSKGGLAVRDTDQAWLDTHESGYQLTKKNGRGSTSKSARASPSRIRRLDPEVHVQSARTQSGDSGPPIVESIMKQWSQYLHR